MHRLLLGVPGSKLGRVASVKRFLMQARTFRRAPSTIAGMCDEGQADKAGTVLVRGMADSWGDPDHSLLTGCNWGVVLEKVVQEMNAEALRGDQAVLGILMMTSHDLQLRRQRSHSQRAQRERHPRPTHGH